MLKLSFGFWKFQSGDKGKPLFDAMNFNTERLNSHSHNGADSTKLSILAVQKSTQSISNANWALDSDGVYKQTIIMVGGLKYDETIITFRDASDGSLLSLDVKKSDTSSFHVYCNDPTKNVTVIYS